MKQVILKSIVSIFLLLITSTVITAQTTFTIGSLTNVNTATITIPVTVTNFNNIAGIQGSINWDNTKLTYNSITGINSALSGISFSSSAGRVGYAWTEPNATGINIANNTVIFNLVLNVVPTASGTVTLTFTTTPTDLLVIDGALNPVNTTYNSGTVQIPVALPTVFKAISVAKAGNTAIVSWNTLTETNTHTFDIERSHSKNTNFIKVASLPANGSVKAYTFTDNTLTASPEFYYRIKAIDADGKISYSHVVYYKNNTQQVGLQLYPNPAKNSLQLQIVNATTETKTLVIADISGKILVQQNISLVNGTTSVGVDVTALKAGNYVISIANSNFKSLLFTKN